MPYPAERGNHPGSRHVTEPEREHLFEWQDAGGVAVVHFKTTHLRDDRQIRAVFDALEQLVASGQPKVVMKFAGLQAFASYAIGKLILLHDCARKASGRLALCALTPTVAEIVEIMNLHKRFEIYP